jgi:hypothetical protein
MISHRADVTRLLMSMNSFYRIVQAHFKTQAPQLRGAEFYATSSAVDTHFDPHDRSQVNLRFLNVVQANTYHNLYLI